MAERVTDDPNKIGGGNWWKRKIPPMDEQLEKARATLKALDKKLGPVPSSENAIAERPSSYVTKDKPGDPRPSPIPVFSSNRHRTRHRRKR